MRERQLGSTTHPITFLLVSSTDHVTGATGLTPTVTISKDGAASFTTPAGAVTEMANGWYALAGNATDRNTLGAFVVHATAAGADVMDVQYGIVGYDPFNAASLGLTNLAPLTFDANGKLNANVFDVAGTTISSLVNAPANFSSLSISGTGKVAATVAANDCADAAASLAIDQLYAGQLPTGTVAASPAPTTSAVTVNFAISVTNASVLKNNIFESASYGGLVSGVITDATGSGTTWALAFGTALDYAPTAGDKVTLKAAK